MAALATPYAGAVHLSLVTIVVSDYDSAISFFVDALGFELVEDSQALTNDGRPKRWVVVKPPGGATGLLLARVDGEHQVRVIGSKPLDGSVSSSMLRTSAPPTRGWRQQSAT